MLEMFDILHLFMYDDLFHPPRIINCPNISRSIKNYSPRAVSNGYHAIFFNTKVFRCYQSQLTYLIPLKKLLSFLEIHFMLEMLDISSFSGMMTHSTHAELFVAPIFPDQ